MSNTLKCGTLSCVFFQFAFVLASCLLLTACATKSRQLHTRDPFENFNRHTYRMNDKLDKAIMKPIATGYKTITPPPLRKGIYNFFSNLDEIPSVINDLLQLHPKIALKDAERFVINSTMGILGFIDVATRLGLPHNDQDFGQTLGRWGFTESSYFVIPLLGPSTIRDVIGRPIDYNFFSLVNYVEPLGTRNKLIATDYVSRRAALLGTEKVLAESFDPYAFMRDSYLQKRDQLIAEKRGKHYAAVNANNNKNSSSKGQTKHDGDDPFVPE